MFFLNLNQIDVFNWFVVKKNGSLFLGINGKMLVNYEIDKWVLQLALMFVETIFKLLSDWEFCQA